jgi:hypothetical protein
LSGGRTREPGPEHRAAWLAAVLALAAAPAIAAEAPPGGELPRRVRTIVIHTLGGPFYPDPSLRFAFFTPQETLRHWGRGRFGAHWIVGADGALWARHAAAGEAASVSPPVGQPADPAWRARLAREAAPVYSHVYDANSRTVGVELAHSGASRDPFPAAQVRTLAWLLRTLLEMSAGRLTPADVRGHKDLDRRPAWSEPDCQREGCPCFIGVDGEPLRRRVDPPESVFVAVAGAGLSVPRREAEGDRHLLRAEAIPAGTIPHVRR